MKHVSIVWIGLLIGLLLSAIFRWIGLPDASNLLKTIFGESACWNGLIIFGILALVLFILFKTAIRRDKEKT